MLILLEIFLSAMVSHSLWKCFVRPHGKHNQKLFIPDPACNESLSFSLSRSIISPGFKYRMLFSSYPCRDEFRNKACLLPLLYSKESLLTLIKTHHHRGVGGILGFKKNEIALIFPNLLSTNEQKPFLSCKNHILESLSLCSDTVEFSSSDDKFPPTLILCISNNELRKSYLTITWWLKSDS